MSSQISGIPRTSFVQTAGGLTFVGGSLTLLDLAPATVFLAGGSVGFLTTSMFLDRWYHDRNGPATHSIAAVLSLLDPDRMPEPDARLLVSLPRIQGTGLSYQVVLGDHLPARAGACVLFIDPPEQPVTPAEPALLA
jgi:hypothetical protein